jgi:type IV pilus assembly protein PilA
MATITNPHLSRNDEQGFTLIELMVVVLIIAILLAIAIPTFLGARNTANARAAQSDLRNALTAEQVQWTNGQTFSSNTSTSAGMGAIESALTWIAGPPTVGNVVGVAVGDPDTSTPANYQVVVLEAFGKDANCWYIEQSNDPTGSSTGYAVVPASGTPKACPAPTAPSAAPAAPASGLAINNKETVGTAPAAYYTSF